MGRNIQDIPPLDPHRQYVIGTAGHIDHGKTALVKALTGVDTDRLPEEKARGITIDLGFAHLADNVTIIDVPGHERLIKNMVAGVSTIDLVLFVVAADDGVMPQTREHLDIVNLLQIRHGLFVITKTDLVDEEWLALVEEDIRALLRETPFQEAPILRTSAATGAGIPELRAALFRALAQIPPRQDVEVYRQPVDRVFSARGFGTVVTGTVLGGRLRVGDTVEIQPAGLKARVRGLQTHERDTQEVRVGFRAAVNLAGVEKEQIERGMVLVPPDLYHPAEMLNARITLLKSSPIPLKNNQRVRLHLHTVETFARVIIPRAPRMEPGESGYVQLRLEEPVHAAFQDRFILRQFSPQRTIGGGVVLQVNPFRYRKRYAPLFQETLQRLEQEEDPSVRLLAPFDRLQGRPLTLWDIKLATNMPVKDLQKLLKQMMSQNLIFAEEIGGKTHYFSREQLEVVLERLEGILHQYHQAYPGRAGMPESEIISRLEKLFFPAAIRRALLFGVQVKRLVRDRQLFRRADFTPRLSAGDSEVYQQIEAWYREAGFAPPTVKEVMARFDLSPKLFKELIRLMREEGQLVAVDETLFFHSTVFPELKEKLKAFFQQKPEITVPEFKELTGTTRKHSIPLLTYLDAEGITERHGDVRKPGPKLK
ncbi:MAG: selenocysteine-specific translation elongation factor [Calditrichaeota bacterium]|nr:MAG: selenocysteine-specific translation elongation factor [Calditrichota bacterium]